MVRTEQYTSGGEFKLPDGTNYVGAYHVHITKGAMVGAYHKDTPKSVKSTAISACS